jgi:hypothetical protein
MRPFFAFISPANRTCACMLCLTYSFNSCLSGTTTTEQKKDPNKRIGARQAMRFYKLRCCLRISKENRGLRFGEIIKLCNKEWAALAATEKEDNRKMLAEYIRFQKVSRQSKQDIPWHGQPYSLIPWLWSIALFHHTLA